jgi:glyoxylase-like metal-dependent hydrolase (beta-lactamase superfamily II)
VLSDLVPGIRWRPAVLRREFRVRCNAYCVDDLLVEPAVNCEAEAQEWLEWIALNRPSRILMTHWHPDHLGLLEQIAIRASLPLWGPEGCPLDTTPTVVRPGDQVGAFEVLAAPGHAGNHVVFYDAARSILVLGDAHQPGDGWSHQFFRTCDALASLNPEVALPAHGLPFLEHSFLDHIALRHTARIQILMGGSR